MKTFNGLWVLTLLAALALSACGSAAATPELPSPLPTDPQPAPVETDSPQPTEKPAAPAANPFWREYRDARFGYGLALPCFWGTTPPPAEGDFAALSIRNFTEAFRLANSTKGYWEWPNGSLAMDMIVIEQVPAELSLMDAVNWYFTTYTSEGQQISDQVESQAGAHSTVVVTLTSTVNPADIVRVTYLRLAPDKLLMVALYPQTAWATPDVNGILASLALTPDEAVTFPAFDPASPPDGTPLACP